MITPARGRKVNSQSVSKVVFAVNVSVGGPKAPPGSVLGNGNVPFELPRRRK